MSAASVATAAYIVAFLLFIMSLAGLSRHESSRHGVVYGIAGMTIALAATIGLIAQDLVAVTAVLLIVGILVGGSIGLWRARVVES